jgi:hypothetical protein
MTNFCKDCKHKASTLTTPVCKLEVTEVDYVYGFERYLECSQARMKYGSCGPEGKNFEPKHELTPPPTSETIKAGYQRFITFWK